MIRWIPSRSSKYTDRKVERQGREDGRLSPPIPHWEADDLPPYLKEIWQAGDAAVQHILEAWKRLDQVLHAKWQAAFLAVVHAGQTLPILKQALSDSEAAYELRHQRKAPSSDMRFTSYGIACVLFAVCEVPFNEIVFRSAGESELLTLVFTVGLAGAVVFCAHWVGVTARSRQIWASLLYAIVGLAAISGVSWLRALHLSGSNHEVAATVIFQPLTLFAYFSFNLLLFTVMAAYAYHVHDEPLVEVFRWRNAVLRAERAFRTAHGHFVKAHSNRMNRHARHCAQAFATTKHIRRLFEAYKTHNLRARTDRDADGRDYPKCFDLYGVPDIPDALSTLTWDAPVEAQTTFAAIAALKENAHETYPNNDATVDLVAHRNNGAHAGSPASGMLD